jgi:hypothetical protein
VDQRQVHRSNVYQVEAPLKAREEILPGQVNVPNLGGNEHLLARNAARADGPPDMRFGSVGLSRVEVTVAELETRHDRAKAFLTVAKPGSEAELGNVDHGFTLVASVIPSPLRP